MEQYISKSAVVAEIEKLKEENKPNSKSISEYIKGGIYGFDLAIEKTLGILDTLEVKDPYEQCIQYPSIEDGIKAHTGTYSFNIESELFSQLTKEQQALWRKEIEQACISGGEIGVELARDPRYKENVEVKDVSLMIHTIISECCDWLTMNTNLSHDKIEGCRNLMLTVKEEQFKT